MSRPQKIHPPLGVTFLDAIKRIADTATRPKKVIKLKIKLTYGELRLLLRQDPKTAGSGGFQAFLVQLGYRVDETSGELDLDNEDLNKINRYATKYGTGGFESRMFKIFGRTLGESLGWPEKYKKFLQ